MSAKNFHVRQAAVSALRAWAKGHDYAETLIERHAQRRKLSSSDRGLLQAILFGVLRHRRLLDHWIGKLRDGMTTANYGAVWSLDHTVPIMQRNADGTRPDQETIISRFSYLNVQPILIAEHRAKTTAEKVARFMPPLAPPPVRQLTDQEFDELMAALGIEY